MTEGAVWFLALNGGGILVGSIIILAHRWNTNSRADRLTRERDEALRKVAECHGHLARMGSEGAYGSSLSVPATGDNLQKEIRCPKCSSARVAECREMSVGGKKLDDARWANLGPLSRAKGREIEMTCLSCMESFHVIPE